MDDTGKRSVYHPIPPKCISKKERNAIKYSKSIKNLLQYTATRANKSSETHNFPTEGEKDDGRPDEASFHTPVLRPLRSTPPQPPMSRADMKRERSKLLKREKRGTADEPPMAKYVYKSLNDLRVSSTDLVNVYGRIIKIESGPQPTDLIIRIEDESGSVVARMSPGSSFRNEYRLVTEDIIRIHRAKVVPRGDSVALRCCLESSGCHVVVWRGDERKPLFTTSKTHTMTDQDMKRVVELRRLDPYELPEEEAPRAPPPPRPKPDQPKEFIEKQKGLFAINRAAGTKYFVPEYLNQKQKGLIHNSLSISPTETAEDASHIALVLEINDTEYFNWFAVVLSVIKYKNCHYLRLWDGTMPQVPGGDGRRLMQVPDGTPVCETVSEVSIIEGNVLREYSLDVSCYGEHGLKAKDFLPGDVILLANIHCKQMNTTVMLSMHQNYAHRRYMEKVPIDHLKHVKITNRCKEMKKKLMEDFHATEAATRRGEEILSSQPENRPLSQGPLALPADREAIIAAVNAELEQRRQSEAPISNNNNGVFPVTHDKVNAHSSPNGTADAAAVDARVACSDAPQGSSPTVVSQRTKQGEVQEMMNGSLCSSYTASQYQRMLAETSSTQRGAGMAAAETLNQGDPNMEETAIESRNSTLMRPPENAHSEESATVPSPPQPEYAQLFDEAMPENIIRINPANPDAEEHLPAYVIPPSSVMKPIFPRVLDRNQAPKRVSFAPADIEHSISTNSNASEQPGASMNNTTETEVESQKRVDLASPVDEKPITLIEALRLNEEDGLGEQAEMTSGLNDGTSADLNDDLPPPIFIPKDSPKSPDRLLLEESTLSADVSMSITPRVSPISLQQIVVLSPPRDDKEQITLMSVMQLQMANSPPPEAQTESTSLPPKQHTRKNKRFRDSSAQNDAKRGRLTPLLTNASGVAPLSDENPGISPPEGTVTLTDDEVPTTPPRDGRITRLEFFKDIPVPKTPEIQKASSFGSAGPVFTSSKSSVSLANRTRRSMTPEMAAIVAPAPKNDAATPALNKARNTLVSPTTILIAPSSSKESANSAKATLDKVSALSTTLQKTIITVKPKSHNKRQEQDKASTSKNGALAHGEGVTEWNDEWTYGTPINKHLLRDYNVAEMLFDAEARKGIREIQCMIDDVLNEEIEPSPFEEFALIPNLANGTKYEIQNCLEFTHGDLHNLVKKNSQYCLEWIKICDRCKTERVVERGTRSSCETCYTKKIKECKFSPSFIISLTHNFEHNGKQYELIFQFRREALNQLSSDFCTNEQAGHAYHMNWPEYQKFTTLVALRARRIFSSHQLKVQRSVILESSTEENFARLRVEAFTFIKKQ